MKKTPVSTLIALGVLMPAAAASALVVVSFYVMDPDTGTVAFQVTANLVSLSGSGASHIYAVKISNDPVAANSSLERHLGMDPPKTTTQCKPSRFLWWDRLRGHGLCAGRQNRWADPVVRNPEDGER